MTSIASNTNQIAIERQQLFVGVVSNLIESIIWCYRMYRPTILFLFDRISFSRVC